MCQHNSLSGCSLPVTERLQLACHLAIAACLSLSGCSLPVCSMCEASEPAHSQGDIGPHDDSACGGVSGNPSLHSSQSDELSHQVSDVASNASNAR